MSGRRSCRTSRRIKKASSGGPAPRGSGFLCALTSVLWGVRKARLDKVEEWPAGAEEPIRNLVDVWI